MALKLEITGTYHDIELYVTVVYQVSPNNIENSYILCYSYEVVFPLLVRQKPLRVFIRRYLCRMLKTPIIIWNIVDYKIDWAM